MKRNIKPGRWIFTALAITFIFSAPAPLHAETASECRQTAVALFNECSSSLSICYKRLSIMWDAC